METSKVKVGYIRCPICSKHIGASEMGLRSHLTSHINSGEITEARALEIRREHYPVANKVEQL